MHEKEKPCDERRILQPEYERLERNIAMHSMSTKQTLFQASNIAGTSVAKSCVIRGCFMRLLKFEKIAAHQMLVKKGQFCARHFCLKFLNTCSSMSPSELLETSKDVAASAPTNRSPSPPVDHSLSALSSAWQLTEYIDEKHLMMSAS